MRFLLLISFICILSVVEIFADLSLMEWASKFRSKNQHWGLIMGIGIYALVGLLYGISLIYGKLSVANTVWQVLSILIVFFIGVYVYSESPTVGQWVGVVIIIVGLMCVLASEPDIWPPNWRLSFWHKAWKPQLSGGCSNKNWRPPHTT